MLSFSGDVVWHSGGGLPAYRGLQGRDRDALDDALAKKKRLVRELHARTCAVLPGTDTLQPFCVPGWSLHREFELFVEAGLTPAQALRTATDDAAAWLGWRDSGRLDLGCRSELLVLAKDPTADLSAMQHIEQVVLQGDFHAAAALHKVIAADLRRREGAFQRVATRVLA